MSAKQVLDNSSAVTDITTTIVGLSSHQIPGVITGSLMPSQSNPLDNALALFTIVNPPGIDALNQAAVDSNCVFQPSALDCRWVVLSISVR